MKVAKRYNNRAEGGVKGEIDYSVEVFDGYNDSIIIVFNIRNKIYNLDNLGKFLEYNRGNSNIVNTNVLVKNITNIVQIKGVNLGIINISYCHSIAGQVARALATGYGGSRARASITHRMEGLILSRVRIGKVITISITDLYIRVYDTFV